MLYKITSLLLNLTNSSLPFWYDLYVLCSLLTSCAPSQCITALLVNYQLTAYKISQGKTQFFHKDMLDLPSQLPIDYWASLSNARLPSRDSLLSSFCSSPLCYVVGFLQIQPHGWHPCLDSWFPSIRPTADFHRLELRHAWRTFIGLFVDAD